MNLFTNTVLGAQNRRAFALVLVLFLIILVAILTTTFLSRSLQGLKLERAGTNRYRAECLARSALMTVTGDLLRELENGSTIETLPNGERLYLPKNRYVQYPTKSLLTSQKALLKISRSGEPWSTRAEIQAGDLFVNKPIRCLSDEADIKGRKVILEQWNRPQFQKGDDIVESPPEWVLVSRNGLKSPTDSVNFKKMSDISSNNSDYVIGRYAYIVYDQSGLININEAGAPSVADDDFKARRGGISQIDLSLLPGILRGQSLSDWRCRGALLNFKNFKKSLFEDKRSCDLINFGNRTFVSRRDLLRYSSHHPDQINPEGVKYLTTFHRSLDTPSIIPDKTRPKTSSENLASGLDDIINPSVFSVTNLKGGLAVKRRFPLSRLNTLEKGEDSALIKKYFGLAKASAAKTWIYNHGESTKILRLQDVAKLGREPDFFETLKAAILLGSLGKTLLPTGSSYLTHLDPYHQFTDYQIVAIGLNIIDQWDADSYPTRVLLDGDEIYGIENLPYLYQIIEQTLRIGGAGGADVGLWFQPEIWNPHQPSNTRSTDGPTKIRFVGEGPGSFYVRGPIVPNVYSTVRNLKETGPGVSCDISINNYCQEPTALVKTNALATGDDLPSDAAYQTVGLSLGTITAPDPLGVNYTHCMVNFQPKISFKLQYLVGNEWINYNQMENVDRTGDGGGSPFTSEHLWSILRVRGDPRTSRFGHGIGLAWNDKPFGPPLGETIRPGKADGSIVWDPIINFATAAGWTYSGSWLWGPISFCYGTLSENTSKSTTRYKDPDGVLRGADGFYVNGLTNDGYPQMPNNLDSRPIILNRPFRSVGEMGYAFRDLPWKHLDFFSETSADAALLDYFSIQENEEGALCSSQIALNTPYEEILTARLAGSSKKEHNLGKTLSKSQAEKIARKIISDLRDDSLGPFKNRSELVSRLISKIEYDNDSDNIIKAQRETVIRSLANDSDTRTWNLMIDLFAQTGCFTNTSRKYADFDVRAQSHYWMHLAIDRYTGKILETKWEKISD